ncbi:MAG: hypothetical protein OXI63_11600 [Candidatus Poribacteria bacterium]|nr:hypothetical protein [Candidatus Poribacteria bacterium]
MKRKRKSKRNIITQQNGPLTAPLHTKEVKQFRVASWCPDLEAKEPPEQVHFVLELEGETRAIVMRFKSPDTLGDLIEQFIEYRREVWPNAEPVKGDIDANRQVNGL